MALLDEIRQKIEAGEYEFSKHAVDQTIVRRISVRDVREVFAHGEVIEDYPDDKYGPSCLIFGMTAGRPVHVQCSYPSRPLIKVITLYEPDPARWIDFKVRRTL
ncbi:MAG TPA: DUF4258 domain-containing protein [Terriglobia bacterium]|nr:DUF4258 domain-containing protein [Terriglobia bacterium]